MATIHQLPDELLNWIFCHATAVPQLCWPYTEPRHESPTIAAKVMLFENLATHAKDAIRARIYRDQAYATGATLALVSRRFHRLAISHLYAELHVGCDRVSWTVHIRAQLPIKTLQLHRSLAHNPALRRLCRRLVLYFSTEKPDVVGVPTDLVTWLTSVRSLVTNGIRATGPGWMLLRRAICHMVNLEQLSVKPLIEGIVDEAFEFDKTYRDGVELPWVVDAVNGFTKLQTLELVGVGSGDEVLKEQKATAPFTELIVTDFIGGWDVLADLIRWPARLEVFDLKRGWTLDVEARDPISGGMTSLRPLLYAHRMTLHTLRICGLVDQYSECEPLATFDLRGLTALTHLTLFHCDTGTNPDFVHHLLAPRLRFFCWDLFTSDVSHGLEGLAQDEEDWLRSLAVKAAGVPGGTSLCRVEVAFAPTEGAHWGDGVYPWDRLERVASDMQRVGIQLLWDEPSVSRERYKELHTDEPQEDQ